MVFDKGRPFKNVRFWQFLTKYIKSFEYVPKYVDLWPKNLPNVVFPSLETLTNLHSR